MSVNKACRKLVESFSSRPTLRSGSLITTVFGDAIAPRGGNVWLGSLITLMADFGISERLVRTSAYRLAQDGWLRSEQIGRRSYYSLSAEGRAQFEAATQRIYAPPAGNWDGRWSLLLLSALATPQKERARKELAWLGYAQLSANLMAHPAPDIAELDEALQRIGVADDLVVLQAETLRNDAGMRRLASGSWNLDELNTRYAAFLAMFRPVLKALENAREVAGKPAFLIRTLLIQEYRKILLRDPQLPVELLPSDWKGAAAYQLCRNLYLSTYRQADDYLGRSVETTDGPLPPPAAAFGERFGGLGELINTRASND